MSVILDALHKARRDTEGREAPGGPGAADTRAVEGHYRTPSAPKRGRRGLLIAAVLASVCVTLLLCAAAFYLVALRLGVIPRGWPISGMQNRPAVTGLNPSVGGTQVVQQGDAVELPGLGAAVSAGPAAQPAPAGTGTGLMPTPAPISEVASIVAGAPDAAASAALPITVQQPGGGVALPPPPPQPPAAVAVATPLPAAPVPAPTPSVTVGTILCDSTGCTAALNGRTVRVGDVFNDYTVMRITEQQVTLQRAGEPPLILHPRF